MAGLAGTMTARAERHRERIARLLDAARIRRLHPCVGGAVDLIAIRPGCGCDDAAPTPVTIGNAGCLCPVHRVTAQRRVRRIALRADPARPE